MTIEPTEFDMIALARRGLQALLDEAVAEVEFAKRYATVDLATRSPTVESAEASDTARRAANEATFRLARFTALYGSPAVDEALSRCRAQSENPWKCRS